MKYLSTLKLPPVADEINEPHVYIRLKRFVADRRVCPARGMLIDNERGLSVTIPPLPPFVLITVGAVEAVDVVDAVGVVGAVGTVCSICCALCSFLP